MMAVAVRGCPQRSGRSRPGRGPSAALVDASLNQSTSTNRPPACKARLGEVVTFEVGGAAQVEGAVALSVVVRSGPIMTAVNGTVVARPEGNLGMPVAAGFTLTIG